MAVIGPGDFPLTMNDLRIVARYAVESAEEVLPLFEQPHPDDRRPRAAVAAAWTFVNGAQRSTLQRVTARDAHRAAKDATTEAAKHAAHAAGDAAAAAYLHPIARATQVSHILRAAAHAARAAELADDDAPRTGDQRIEQARRRATPVLVDVLSRYPLVPTGENRVAQLMKTLDTSLRTPLAGRRSGPGVNGLWGLINLLGGLLLLSPDTHRSPTGWDDDLIAFEGGVLALAAWMVATERLLRTNTKP